MSFDVPMNLFIPAASVTWKSLRRVDVVRAAVFLTLLISEDHYRNRVARKENSGLAGLFLHEF